MRWDIEVYDDDERVGAQVHLEKHSSYLIFMERKNIDAL